MERYPNSGRLVKIYGRFLEFVCNDPWAAARQYQEAMRLGLTDNILGMASGGANDDDAATGRLTALAGAIDEKEDCLIIINADGIILMINRVRCRTVNDSRPAARLCHCADEYVMGVIELAASRRSSVIVHIFV